MKQQKKLYYQCPTCDPKSEHLITLPALLMIDERGLPTCPHCKKHLIRRTRNISDETKHEKLTIINGSPSKGLYTAESISIGEISQHEARYKPVKGDS